MGPRCISRAGYDYASSSIVRYELDAFARKKTLRNVWRYDAMKRTLTIDYGDEVLLALGYTPKQFSEEAKLLHSLHGRE